jgi:N-acetylglucosaminyldiphosphoundecaprenol N-acetyl-beta-D-mannosaminyltransferase
MYLSDIKNRIYNQPLSILSTDKILICCLNAYSFNIAQTDSSFQSALLESHLLLPDGIAIVYALRLLTGIKLKKISGHELFYHEMERLNQMKGKCFFLGSTQSTNFLIKMRISRDFPNIKANSFSPPFKKEFSVEDNRTMINAVNAFQPDVLFIGMTAPKQEKWAAAHFDELNANHICCIGAVFDFYAQTCKRAPNWMINLGFEWFHRLISEPTRLWKRYIFGNTKFLVLIFSENVKIRVLKLKH